MKASRKLLWAVVLLIGGGGALRADVTTRGQVEGQVTSEDGAALAGATLTLTGSGLIGNAVVEKSGEDGSFRFLNLNPGSYALRVELPGLAPAEVPVEVRVGRTSTVRVKLGLPTVEESLTVQASAPLFDQTSAAHGTNLSVGELATLPNDRNFIHAVDAAAGFDNQAAYGAGGNVSDYDPFGFGAATNLYQLNGVTVSNLEFGNSWVNPNYDTIQEVQIVGPGGSAEYANYSSAVVNVVTKSGTNDFAGSVAAYYTDHQLSGDNSDGIKDLEPDRLKRDLEVAATFGGPLVREKLLFFAAVGRNTSAQAPVDTSFYDDLDQQQYQLRLDWLASNQHTLTAMVNYEPIDDKDLGLQALTGPEVGYSRKQETTTGFLSWLSTWSNDTVSEARYAHVEGSHDRLPNAPLGTPAVIDGATGITYNSTPLLREQSNDRDQLQGSVTHYVEQFLHGRHELKGGLEYEDASTRTNVLLSGNALFQLIPLGGPLTYVIGITGYNQRAANSLERPAAYLQDRATFGRTTVSAGLRYDRPRTFDDNTGKALLSFTQWSPRLGIAHDLRGDGHSILRLAAGRYYDKVPTYGVGTYAGTGLDTVSYYGFLAFEPIDPHDVDFLRDHVLRDENLIFAFDSTALPVEEGTKGPHADVINVGFDQELGPKYGLSLNYLYRETKDFVIVGALSNDTSYTPRTVHSDFSGRDFTLWEVTGGSGARVEAVGNRDFFHQKTHFFVAELRARPHERLFLDASLAFEQGRGTLDNNECAVLNLCSVGVDKDPNFQDNPFRTEGAFSQERPWNLKLRGNWQLPYGFETGWDLRWFAGRKYGALDSCGKFPECNDPALAVQGSIPIEPRDARQESDSTFINLRLAKRFAIQSLTATVSVDILNATDEQINFKTYLYNNVNDLYPQESIERGEDVSAFGRPVVGNPPRQFRLGVRLEF